VGFQFGNNFRLENGKPTAIKPPNYINEKPLRYNWNTPVVLSPHNKEIIYYGANKLFRSFDKGDTWKAISKDLTQSLKYGDVPYATITSISESALEFGRIIVGTDDGMIWATEDGGYKWKNIGKKLPRKLWVSRVVASKHDKNTLWLTLNNYRNDDIGSYVYYSKDFGKSWKSISKNLPNEAVNVIKEDPNSKDIIYVGTDKGLYVSFNSGDTWTTLGSDLPTVPVHDLVVHPRDNEIVVATHGRSMWVADISALQSYKDYKDKPLALLKPNAIKFQGSWNSRPSRWFNTPDDNVPSTFTLWSKTQKDITIEIEDNKSQTLFTKVLSLHKGLNIWEWNHRIDPELALKAEEFKNKDEDKPLNKSLTPISEGIRLGHDIYIQKGEYKLKAIDGENKQTEDFIVE
jgi:hypothetical protein